MTTKTLTRAAEKPQDRLSARVKELETRIASLRSERVSATTKGEPYDGAQLRTAEEDLTAVREALAERERQDAEAADKARLKTAKAEDTRVRKRIGELQAARLAAVEDAEATARAHASALRAAEKHRAELQSLLYETFGRTPLELMNTSQYDRLSRGLSAVLHKELGTYSFGEITLRPGHRIVSSEAPWADYEKTITVEIENILKGNHDHADI